MPVWKLHTSFSWLVLVHIIICTLGGCHIFYLNTFFLLWEVSLSLWRSIISKSNNASSGSRVWATVLYIFIYVHVPHINTWDKLAAKQVVADLRWSLGGPLMWMKSFVVMCVLFHIVTLQINLLFPNSIFINIGDEGVRKEKGEDQITGSLMQWRKQVEDGWCDRRKG